MKFATAGYVFFLLLMIFLADTGKLDQYVSCYKSVPCGDKLGHFVLMGFLSFLANMLFRVRTFSFLGQRLLLGSAVVFAVVFIEECSQLFLPRRSFSLLDLSADAAGIWVFGVLAQIVCRRQAAVRPS